MKKIFLIPLILPALLYLSACEKTVDLNVPAEDPKLVVHAYLNPDSTFKVQLNKSVYILEDRQQSRNVLDATIEVFEEGKSLGKMESNQNGWYELKDLKPKPGLNYRIEASRPGMETVVANERALVPVSVYDVSVDTIGTGGHGNTEIEISFYLQDEPGEHFYISRGYYNAMIKTVNTYTGEEYLHAYNSPVSQPVGDPALESFCYNGCFSILRDTFFDGKAHKVRLRGSLPIFEGDFELLEESLSVQLYNVSRSYYLYQASLEQNRQSRYDPFAEPTSMYTNIQGGYGVLGAVSISNHDIAIE